MTPSPLCTTLVAAFEGDHLTPYRCPAGIWTVGYGHTSAMGPPTVTAYGPTLSGPSAARTLLGQDLTHVGELVTRAVGATPLQQHQFDALCSFVFNLGIGNFSASTLLRVLKAGDYAGAAQHFLDWDKYRDPNTGQTLVSSGLQRRREAEQALFNDDLKDASVYAQVDFGPMPQAPLAA